MSSLSLCHTGYRNDFERLVCTVVLASLAGCGRPESSTPLSQILISIDTLRADHLGCYGYSRDTSPQLDALAEESIRFAAAYAPSPWTLPSHAAMLTGEHPYRMGIDNQWRRLPEEVPVVAELLQQIGYQTAAFVDSKPNGFVGAERGFGRGFELYAHSPHRPGQAFRFDTAATVDAAMEWIAGRDPNRPFFLFLHTKSAHAMPQTEECFDERCFPYDVPEPNRFRFVSSQEAHFSWSSVGDGDAQAYLWSQNDKILKGELDPRSYPVERIEVLEALYDTGIHYVDFHLGRLMDDLRKQNLLETTAIIVTSDHGEAFLDHYLFMHQEVYDSLLRVPLLVRLPQAQGRVVRSQVTLSDIVPTLLELAGEEVHEALYGRPLPLTSGSDDVASREPRELFAYYLFPDKFTYRAFTIRRGDWKLVVHNPETPDHFLNELYHTASDPGERQAFSGEEDRVEEMLRALRWRMQQRPVAQGIELEPLKGRDEKALRALGYIE